MRIMNNGKTLYESFQQNLKEADVDESLCQENAAYYFNNYCQDNGDLDDIDLDDLVDYTDNEFEAKRIIQLVLDAWSKVKDHLYYDHENHGPKYIELSDNHTLWNIENDKFPSDEYAADEYNMQVEGALNEFKDETGTELYLLGRSGRHACVDLNYDNATRFDELFAKQEQLEKQVIDNMNNWEPENEAVVTVESADVFSGYDKALPSVNDGREYLGYNLSDVVDAVESFYGCKDRREAFDKIKNKELSDEEIKKAVEAENKPVFEQDSLVRVVTSQQEDRDYSITDITELSKVSDGDVQPPIDISGLLVEVDSRLTESYGEKWGQINFQSTRYNADTKDSNALFELCVGKDTYLMSMLLEENGSVLKVNNTKGQTIFKRKSSDVTSLAESYIKQFLPKEADDVPNIIKHINEDLHDAYNFLMTQIEISKEVPKEEKDEFNKYLQRQLYAFVAEVSNTVNADVPNEEGTLELPSFDKMVADIFGKDWVKEDKEPEAKEIEGAETIKESDDLESKSKDEYYANFDRFLSANAENLEDEYYKETKLSPSAGIYSGYTKEFLDWIAKNYKSDIECCIESSLKESYEVWQKYYDDDGTVPTPEFVQSFESHEEAQKFCDGLNRDPNCEAYIKDDAIEESEDWDKEEPVECNIEYDEEGKPYFMYKGEKEYIDEYMKDETGGAVKTLTAFSAIRIVPSSNGETVTVEYLHESEEPIANEPGEEKPEEPKNGLGTGYAAFTRKPKNLEMVEDKSNYFTEGEASYLICSKQKLTKDEFDKLKDDFLATNKYCKEFEPLDLDNYSYNVIEFSCDDYDYTLLVDPSGYDYCRYVAKIGGNE